MASSIPPSLDLDTALHTTLSSSTNSISNNTAPPSLTSNTSETTTTTITVTTSPQNTQNTHNNTKTGQTPTLHFQVTPRTLGNMEQVAASQAPVLQQQETQAGTGNVVAPGREATGRWTKQEHLLFLEGLKIHGKEWKLVAGHVRTRTVVQTRTHAQKYFQKGEGDTMRAARSKTSGKRTTLLPKLNVECGAFSCQPTTTRTQTHNPQS